MSATISQPTTGRKSSAAPFGAVAILAGVVAIGAIAIAYGPAIKATPVAGVPVDVQTALIQHRADERASLETARDPRLVFAGSELQDRFPADVATDSRLLVNQAELADRIAAAAIPLNPGVIMAQNLVPPTYSGNVRDGSVVVGPTYHPFDPMYMAGSVTGTAFDVTAFLDAEKAAADRFARRAITGTGTGPQTAQQKGLVGPDRWETMAKDKFAQQQLSRIAVPTPHVGGPARHPVAD
jgi:hypothetical protein